VITGSTNFVARIATIIATSGAAKTTEEFFQTDSRKVKQKAAGTATVAANIITRIAVGQRIARIAVGDAGATQTDEPERIQLTKTELRSATDVSTRIAIANDIARIAIVGTTGITTVRGKQTA